jgi:hypothetical protein
MVGGGGGLYLLDERCREFTTLFALDTQGESSGRNSHFAHEHIFSFGGIYSV